MCSCVVKINDFKCLNTAGKGGSEGSGNFTKELKKELIDAFNKIFIGQLDRALNIQHSEDTDH